MGMTYIVLGQHASGDRPLIPTNLTSVTGITTSKYLNSNEELQSSVGSISPVKSSSSPTKDISRSNITNLT